MPHEDICHLIKNPRTGKGISKETLYAHFRKELDEGRVGVGNEVANALHEDE